MHCADVSADLYCCIHPLVQLELFAARAENHQKIKKPRKGSLANLIKLYVLDKFMDVTIVTCRMKYVGEDRRKGTRGGLDQEFETIQRM